MILILGSEGQLSQSFQSLLKNSTSKVDFKVLGRKDIDFLNPDKCIEKIADIKPQWIINAAAYTLVDKAETEKEPCFQINALTPIRISQWCREEQVNFIHYSTDYVFNGEGENAWLETDTTAPLNFYGQTKRASEEGIIQSECPFLIFRISWVYHHHGSNFVKTMLRLGAEREELKIVSDQIGYPSYAPDLAEATLKCIQKIEESGKVPHELLHLSSPYTTNWYEFANSIFSKARELGFPMKVKNVIPIKTSEYPTPATRPLNSRLNSNVIKTKYDIELPHWENSLDRCLRLLKS